MSAGTRIVAPFVLSLVGGVLILVGAIVSAMFAFGSPTTLGSMSGMMGGMSGGMSGTMIGLMMGAYPIFSIIGLVSGALVILGAVMLYNRPFEKDLWGAVVIDVSILGTVGGMGGFREVVVLSAVEGARDRSWNPARRIAAWRRGVHSHD